MNRLGGGLRSPPSKLEAWADAHVALLDEFLSRVAADSTQAFVANKERAAWLQLREGASGWVDRNTYYVHYDPALYADLFGA